MSDHREEFRVEGLAEPISHYTDAVRSGGLLFVSGMVPVDEQGRLVGEGDVVEQTRQVFRNIEFALRAAGPARTSCRRRSRPATAARRATGRRSSSSTASCCACSRRRWSS
jgi:hypothetical protein